jgi:hypothetical protein
MVRERRPSLHVMAWLIRATGRGKVLVQVARTSRAMTLKERCPLDSALILTPMRLDQGKAMTPNPPSSPHRHRPRALIVEHLRAAILLLL